MGPFLLYTINLFYSIEIVSGLEQPLINVPHPVRPKHPSTTNFPNPVNGPAFPGVPNDNVLEINLTEETLSFSAPLGNVPNRGFGTQKDIFLNGVAYIQAVNDVTNTATGRADGPASNIHVEPGTWM